MFPLFLNGFTSSEIAHDKETQGMLKYWLRRIKTNLTTVISMAWVIIKDSENKGILCT